MNGPHPVAGCGPSLVRSGACGTGRTVRQFCRRALRHLATLPRTGRERGKSPGIRIGALASALSRQGDVEGDNVTVDRVVHDEVAVKAELGRVGGEAHCVPIENLKVSAVDLLAVLIV